jgi:uncharacterized DUF497 family protein
MVGQGAGYSRAGLSVKVTQQNFVSKTMALIFEWDEEKGTANAIKHGVAFTEAGTFFGDEQSITIPDLKHSQDEPRFITMGMSQAGRLLVVIHTERGNHLRIISARPASRKERNQYEKAKS